MAEKGERADAAHPTHDIAPSRFRLGVGPGQKPIIERNYGIPMQSPREHLREYVTLLCAALWDGNVEHQGRFFTVNLLTPESRTSEAEIPPRSSFVGISVFPK